MTEYQYATIRKLLDAPWASDRTHLSCDESSKAYLIVWENGPHYLSVEIHKRHVEFFYLHRTTRGTWIANLDGDGELPEAFLAKAKLLIPEGEQS